MKEQQKNGIARLLEIAGRRKRLLWISAILALVHVMITLVPFVIIYSILVELLEVYPNFQAIQVWLYWAAGALTLAFILLYASGMASHIAAFNILFELRNKMAAHLGDVSLGYINDNNSGRLKKVLADDIERIEHFIAHGIPDLVKGIGLPVFVLVYLTYVDWRLALVSCIPLVIVLVFVPWYFSRPQNKELLNKYHQGLEDMNAGIVEYVRAMPVMKIFGQSAENFEKYAGSVNNYHTDSLKWIKNATPPWAIFMSFISNATLPVLTVGLWLYFDQSLGLPTFLLFLILGVGYIKPILSLMNLGPQISMINKGIERLDAVLFSAPLPEVMNSENSISPDGFDVSLKDVDFSYDKHTPTLRGISLHIPQGEVTALVGPSGSGKSTIAQLIARFWDVDKGNISIGGIDVREMPYTELMKHVSFVFQDSFMFQQTLYENIRMGMDKSFEEIIQACKKARCHEFITSLVNGYDTFWGEHGVHLSGGEQQRVQLARAFLKDAPVLVLDEATAFSDPENEHLILQAVNELVKDKTVVVIAHRLSTVKDANQIVVLENGKVNAVGKHETLLEESKLYRKMYDAHTRASQFAI